MSTGDIIVVSGLGRRQCQHIARRQPGGGTWVWVDPETILAPSVRDLLTNAKGVKWLYRRPASRGKAASEGSLRLWISHNRHALALRESFRDKMEFVEVGEQAVARTPLPDGAAEVMRILDLVRSGTIHEPFSAMGHEHAHLASRLDPELGRLHREQVDEELNAVCRQRDRYHRELLAAQAELARLRQVAEEASSIRKELLDTQAQLALLRDQHLDLERKAGLAERSRQAEAAKGSMLEQQLRVATDAVRALERRQLELVHELSCVAQAHAEWVELRRQRESSRKGLIGALDRLPRVRAYRTTQQKARSYQGQLDLIRNSEWFDAAWYLERNPDVLESGMDPATHFHDFGWKEYRNPGPAFHTRRYMLANLDVTASGINPLLHFIQYGCKEGRSPCPADPCTGALESP